MKFLRAASILTALLAVSISQAGARPTLTISRPPKGATFPAGHMFTISGHATPADRVSVIRVRVAGQRLIAMGTGSWKVDLTIGLPGRHKVVVASKIGNKVVVRAQRYVRIVP